MDADPGEKRIEQMNKNHGNQNIHWIIGCS